MKSAKCEHIIFIKYFIRYIILLYPVVTTVLDKNDPLWEEMHEQDTIQLGTSSTVLQDSGCGSSLACTPRTTAPVDLNISKESGEITAEENVVKHETVDLTEQSVIDNGYVAGSLYVASSLVERMVLDCPPAPQLGNLAATPVSGATLITDRVGVNLTKLDKVIYMLNNVASDFWELARLVGKYQVAVQFKYVFVMIGLDWCLTGHKYMIKEGLRHLIYAVSKITDIRATVAICGITPRYDNYRETKFKTVTFNRYLGDAARECTLNRAKVAFLPLHLHFLHPDGEFISPVHRYFN